MAPSSAFATFPGQNGRIVYSRNAVIHTILPNGNKDRTLTRGEGPAWSPNGHRIAFVRSIPSDEFPYFTGELFSMRPDGSGLRRLTHNHLIEGVPAYSPSGRHIAFQGEDASGYQTIFSMRSNGSHRKPLAAGESPVYSPNGRWIAFTQDSISITVMRPDGSHLHDLVNSPPDALDDAPDYSPDGRTIAFTRSYEFENTERALTVPANGGPIKRLGRCATRAPAFSPDGRLLASDTGASIRITPVDGSCPARILAGDDAGGASWRSLPRGYHRSHRLARAPGR